LIILFKLNFFSFLKDWPLYLFFFFSLRQRKQLVELTKSF